MAGPGRVRRSRRQREVRVGKPAPSGPEAPRSRDPLPGPPRGRSPPAGALAPEAAEAGAAEAAGAEGWAWDRAAWRAGYASCSAPCSEGYWMEVEGEIPADLEGTYYRNGPGQFEVGAQRIAHPFDGDGLVVSVAVKDGRAFFRSRFVETEGFLAERAAGRILYRNTFGTQRQWDGRWPERVLSNFGDVTQKNVANTNVISWAGKTLCLWEASQPHRIHPATLATEGVDTLGGLLREGLPFATGAGAVDDLLEGTPFGGDPFTAHPHVEAATGKLIGFGYQVTPGGLSPTDLQTTFTFYEFEEGSFTPQWKPVTYTVPKFAFTHDFCFTDRWYVVFQSAVEMDMGPFMAGLKCPGECMEFQDGEPATVHLIPRPGKHPPGTKPRVINMESCFVFHHANAYEDEAGDIIADSVRLPRLADFSMDGDFLDVNFDTYPVNQLYRHRISLAGPGKVESARVSDRVVEFPAVNPIVFGRKHRYVFVGAAQHPTRNQPLQGVLKCDLETGAEETFFLNPGTFMGECEVIPKRDAASEDDVWLVAMCYNGEALGGRGQGQVLILDGADLAAGPVATLRTRPEHHVPYGLHGNWADAYHGP